MGLDTVVARYRRFRVPVVLLGPPGVGKSRLARALHVSGPFVAVNCAQLGAELFAAELFGTAPGAFTGATSRPGRLAEADGGTLLLDEAGELPDRHQAQLTTFLDDGLVTRLGEDRPRRVQVRVILATWKAPATWMRPDLRDRFGHHVITVPPPDPADLSAALEDHLAAFAARYGVPRPRLGDCARSALVAEARGSYREPLTRLELGVMRALEQGDDTVTAAHLPPAPDADVARDAERAWVDTALRAGGGNVTSAARLARVSRATMYRRIRRAREGSPAGGDRG